MNVIVLFKNGQIITSKNCSYVLLLREIPCLNAMIILNCTLINITEDADWFHLAQDKVSTLDLLKFEVL
jgi:hypothetical protein